ncbi:hypothetical protein [Demequina aurantiaca]|uniref:hypothetical protein n=1 Tax=Demequina aurantiaca TaxID=676200 RepID=UPI0007817383|nr:hypothetical protein [Demequina aurantiaca]
MIIDCDTCEVRDKACGDCVVSFLTIPVRAGAAAPRDTHGVWMDAEQEAAVEALVAGGLVPPLRLVHSAEPRSLPPRVARTGQHAS